MPAPTSPRPVTLVILGATGDLTARLLLPGLGTLLRQQPKRKVTLIGASYEDMAPAAWKKRVTKALKEGGATTTQIDRIVKATRFEVVDVTNAESFGTLVSSLKGRTVLYFALPPAVTIKACEVLAKLDLPADLMLALEKPFGTDLESARHLNALLATFVHERQIFRVDHFLGIDTVLNLLGVRFANRIFEPVWNAQHIERIEVVFDETLALEGRAGYYDKAGALVDMLQSHLLLVMAVATMEEPTRIDHGELRDLMAHTLRATEVYDDDPAAYSRRARYTVGKIGRRQVPSYVDEVGVDRTRNTETLAEITVEIRNNRWAGVPITLRSGKAAAQDRHHVRVVFKPVPHVPHGLSGEAVQNELTLEMFPDRLELRLATNGQGDKFNLEETVLAADIGDSPILPYGEVLAGVFDANPMLGVRGDISEECWRIVTPVLEAWQAGEVPMQDYAAGTDGPASWDQDGVGR